MIVKNQNDFYVVRFQIFPNGLPAWVLDLLEQILPLLGQSK